MNVKSFRRAAAFAGIAWAAAAACSSPCVADDSHQVPLVDQLTVMTAVVTENQGDYAKDRQALVYGIYFKFNRADIRPVSEPVLNEMAAILKKNPDWKLAIVGHTDNVGRDAANLDLSRRRAQSVRAALVERYAIDGNRLTTGGFGASQPQAKNDTPEGRARNRRVELTRQ